MFWPHTIVNFITNHATTYFIYQFGLITNIAYYGYTYNKAESYDLPSAVCTLCMVQIEKLQLVH